MIASWVKRCARNLPYLREVVAERDRLRAAVPTIAGHYYSPIPSLNEVRRREHRIFAEPASRLPGLDMNETGQLELLDQLKAYHQDFPFGPDKKDGLRYHYDNGYYGRADGIFLYCMIRHLKPKRIVEVGSGFSSAL